MFAKLYWQKVTNNLHNMESTLNKIMIVQNQELRRRHILDNLLIGDVKKIAKRMGKVTPVWVSYVLHGKGTRRAGSPGWREALLAERKEKHRII